MWTCFLGGISMRCDPWRFLGHLLRGPAFGLSLLSSANALAVDTANEYDKNIKASQNVGVLGNDLAGDRVNFYTGSTELAATDVSLPGNSGLSVAVGRRYAVETDHTLAEVSSNPSSSALLAVSLFRSVDTVALASAVAPISSVRPYAFGDQDLDIPYLTGVFEQSAGWQIDSTTPTQRCSVVGQVTSTGAAATGAPKNVGTGYGTIIASAYWHGHTLHLPGGDQSLLLASLPNANRPSSGGPYHWVTNQNWWLSCLPSLKNANSTNVGEGFVAISPDGTKYAFDWLSRRNVNSVSKEFDLEGQYKTGYVFRTEVFLLPTRIEDRFGNWVQYGYSNDTYAKLLTVTANDGRSLSLTYNAQGYVDTLSDGSRTWRYSYTNGSLSQVTLPDASVWQYGLANLNALTNDTYSDCVPDPHALYTCYGSETPVLGGTPTGYAVHPSGGRTDFTFALHFQPAPNDAYFYPLGLTQKTLSGPGLTSATWRYAFAPSAETARSQCLSGACPSKVWTDEVALNDDVTRRLYSLVAGQDQSLLIGELQGQMVAATEEGMPVNKNGKMAEVYDQASPGTTTVPSFYRQLDLSYVPAAQASNFVYQLGVNPLQDGQVYVSERAVPQVQRLTTVQGSTFTWQVNSSNGLYSFDTYGQPTGITRSSSLGYSRSETTEYSTNTAKWVLGQVSKVTDSGTGKLMQQTTYESTTALPLQDYRFGLLQQTRTYNADGTLATVTDGLSHTTRFSDWYRGLPRLITYANATTQSATVSALGLPLTVTDELGYTTTYGYDALGRLAKITPPTGDSIAWNATDRSFVPVSSSEYGLPAGHWKQTVSTGNGRTTTYYDGRWQPVLTLTEDTGNAATQSFTVRRFDALGRETFSAYPVASLSTVDDPLLGVLTTYDALGRVILSEQDSELGVLTTTTEYLTGFQTRVTDPRNQQTTTSYQVFDVPSLDAPVGLTAPEGVSTAIARDGFGKALTVTRSGPSGQP
jgi:YD repeat-containing protein